MVANILQCGFYWPTLFRGAYIFFLHVMDDNVWKYYTKAHDGIKTYSSGRDFLCVGHRFYGTFSSFFLAINTY